MITILHGSYDASRQLRLPWDNDPNAIKVYGPHGRHGYHGRSEDHHKLRGPHGALIVRLPRCTDNHRKKEFHQQLSARYPAELDRKYQADNILKKLQLPFDFPAGTNTSVFAGINGTLALLFF